MSNGEPAEPQDTNDRRDVVREKAKQLRADQRKKDLRNRILIQGGIGVVLLAIIAAVAIIVVTSIRPATAGPKNMASDGIVIGAELKAMTTPALAAGADPIPTTTDPTVAHIRLYIDYLCPWCGQFEAANMEQMKDWMSTGAAVVEFHPIALLTSKSVGTQFSLRAANAAACVANYSPDKFLSFNSKMFANQPEEGTEGLTDAEIVAIAYNAGASSSVESCVKDMDFKAWVQAATQRALDGPLPGTKVKKVEGTPTILVNGKAYTGSFEDPKEFQAFVVAATSETYATSTPVPSGSPSPKPSVAP